MKTSTQLALLATAFVAALFLVTGPAAAEPVADQQAARTRPQSSPSKVGGTSSSGGQTQSAQPRSSTSNRSGEGAVRRSDAGRELGRRDPRVGGSRRGDRWDGGYYWGGTIYWGPHYVPWSWPWGWWGWWGGYYPYTYEPVRYYPHQVRPSMGALDLDLRPEEARVYLNGQEIGIADNYDGWPRYLWLEEGTYDLVFYREGYETIARQYTIYPGVVIDVEDRMRRGEATPPEELFAKSTEIRDERLRRNEERREAAERMEPDWKERVRSEREQVEDRDERMDRDGPYDARVEPARLTLSVEPRDAAIYLDGRFIGAADEILTDRAGRTGLVVDPGEHELEIVRPGYVSKRKSFTAESGETVDLTIELEQLE